MDSSGRRECRDERSIGRACRSRNDRGAVRLARRSGICGAWSSRRRRGFIVLSPRTAVVSCSRPWNAPMDSKSSMPRPAEFSAPRWTHPAMASTAVSSKPDRPIWGARTHSESGEAAIDDGLQPGQGERRLRPKRTAVSLPAWVTALPLVAAIRPRKQRTTRAGRQGDFAI